MRDLVLEVELAFLEALQLQLILDGALREAGYDVIEVPVLEVQLVDTLPEHFTVGGMYHGEVPPYRLDESQYRPKKNKKRGAESLPRGCFSTRSGRVRRRFFHHNNRAIGVPVCVRRPECHS